VAAKVDDHPMPIGPAGADGLVPHKVRKGERWRRSPEKYRNRLQEHHAGEHLPPCPPRGVGTTLRVPLECAPDRSQPLSTAKARPKREPAGARRPSGRLPFNIAKRYGTTTEEIQRRNKLSRDRFERGAGAENRSRPRSGKTEPRKPQPERIPPCAPATPSFPSPRSTT